MILSPESINFFLTGKRYLDHKAILKFAKLRDLKVSDSLRKNLSNNFAGYNQSETTISNIKSFLKKLIDNELFEKSIDDIGSSEKLNLSTPALRLKHIQSHYDMFFKSAQMEKSFLFHELNKTFNGLKKIISLKESGALESSIELKINQGELFPRINFCDSLFLEVKNKVPPFNFDLLLYYFACLDVEDKFVGKTPFQLFLEYLLIDITSEETIKLKSTFEYYTLVVKYFHKNEGKKITDQEISQFLGMTVREFYLHKSGERNLQLKTIKIITKNGHFIYFTIRFFLNLITLFLRPTNTRSLIIDKINNYPNLISNATVEFKSIEKNIRKQGASKTITPWIRSLLLFNKFLIVKVVWR